MSVEIQADERDDPVAAWFEFATGQTIPLRRFEDADEEMQYLVSTGAYGRGEECAMCGQRAPFIVSATRSDAEDVAYEHRSTCMECWGQIRIPADHEGAGESWTFHEDRAAAVALESVPAYREQPLGEIGETQESEDEQD